jgi:3-oxoacyl-[acyl-carrier-protein] synthase III
MNEEALNNTVRKFLKKVGITSQREIEMAVREAVASGRLKGNESLLATATVQIEGLGLKFDVEGDVELE